MQLSIIIPVYNAGSYLEKCINSILSQNADLSYEILLIDDGSTDNSASLCDHYSMKFSNIRTIHQKNSGVSSARNRGLTESCGEYIMFVDSDDYLKEDMFNIIDTYINMNYDLIITGYMRISESEETFAPLNKEDSKQPGFWSDLYMSSIFNVPFAKIYSNKLVENISFDEKIAIGEDLVFNLKCYEQAKSILCVPYAGYYYIQVENSAMHKYNPERLEMISMVHNSTLNFLKSKNISAECVNEVNFNFLGGILDCISTITYSNLSRKEKLKQIRYYVNDELTRYCLINKYNKGLKYNVLFWLIKQKQYNILFLLYKFLK